MRGVPKVLVTYSSVYDRLLTSYHGREYAQETSRRGRTQAAKIQEAWDRHSTRILTAMTRLSGLKWKRREIRAYVVTYVRYPFSEPLTLWIGKRGGKVESQITFLIHELSHTLLADNETALSGYWKATQTSHRKESHTTIIHIPVQALVIETLRTVFGKAAEGYVQHERWWEYSKANPDMKDSYARSWSIVIDKGPLLVLERLRVSIGKRFARGPQNLPS